MGYTDGGIGIATSALRSYCWRSVTYGGGRRVDRAFLQPSLKEAAYDVTVHGCLTDLITDTIKWMVKGSFSCLQDQCEVT